MYLGFVRDVGKFVVGSYMIIVSVVKIGSGIFHVKRGWSKGGLEPDALPEANYCYRWWTQPLSRPRLFSCKAATERVDDETVAIF